MKEFSIIPLPKERWQGAVLTMDYTTGSHYAAEFRQEPEGFFVELKKTAFPQPVTHTSAEYDFPDSLYQPHWTGVQAWGVAEEGALRAAIETCPEDWSKRLRVTELWVAQDLRGKGLGRALMNLAKDQAAREGFRAVILETQSCNVNAIGFYLHEGFSLIGMDRCAYSNRDVQRCEVRLELGWFPEAREEAAGE